MEMTGLGFLDIFFADRKKRTWGFFFPFGETPSLCLVRTWTQSSEMPLDDECEALQREMKAGR